AASGTSQRFPLLVHCHLRWDFVWQRPQQLFSRLAAHHAVLFIEDPLPGEGEARLELSEPYPNVVRMLPRLPQAEPLDVDAQWRLLLPLTASLLLQPSRLKTLHVKLRHQRTFLIDIHLHPQGLRLGQPGDEVLVARDEDGFGAVV